MHPEVDFLGVELAQCLEAQPGPAVERDDLVLVLRPGLQFLLPMGLKLLSGLGRQPSRLSLSGHFTLQPARSRSEQLELPKMIGRARRIAQAWRVDLVSVLFEEHLLRVFQVDLRDLVVFDIALQALGAGLQTLHRRVERRGCALGLDAGRLEIEAWTAFLFRRHRAGGRDRPREEDR